MLRYEPKLNHITGGVEETIFFLQCLYWKEKMYKAFYKFQSPCGHFLFKSGESWEEELGFTSHQIRKCKNNVGSRLKIGQVYPVDDLNLVLYWKGGNNLTFYLPNYLKILSFPEDVQELIVKQLPHLRSWKSEFLKCEISISDIQFSPSRNASFAAPYIHYTTHQTKQKNKAEGMPADFIFFEDDMPSTLEKEKSCAKKEKEIVLPFETEKFKTIWSQWKAYQKEKYNKPFTSTSEQAALMQLAEYNEAFSIKLLMDAMANGWRSFHFDETPQKFQKYLKSKNNGNIRSNSGEEFAPHAAKFFQKYSSTK